MNTILCCSLVVVTYCSVLLYCILPSAGCGPSVPGRRQHREAGHPEDEREQSGQVPRTLLRPAAPSYTYTHRYSFFLLKGLLKFFHLWLSVGPLDIVFSLRPVALLLNPSLLAPPLTTALYLLPPITHCSGHNSVYILSQYNTWHILL